MTENSSAAALALAAFGYLATISVALAFCLFGGLRAAARNRLFTAWSAILQAATRLPRRMNLSNAVVTPGPQGIARKTPNPAWIVLLLIAVPLSALVGARRWMHLEGYADLGLPGSQVVAGLLAGERLSPPLPLPPEVFTTRELLAERPLIASASRDWNLLDDDFSQKLLHLFQQMRDEGYEMVLLEGYRSPERQQKLADEGPQVTRAGAFQSYHQYGLAADCAFLRQGRIVISERDPWAMRGYQRYGELAESLGLTWGGRWKMMDLGHVELRGTRKLDPARTGSQ
ncbi:M15 family metallopeptidase [Niveibacterium sp. SC-1]|uniref:M15 family metallopeptidase n=1 Tax=Niveibacterium sp. SC-1 TaxID=3135646 RepID=UPI00311EDD91